MLVIVLKLNTYSECVCHRLRLTKRDDYFRVIFDHFLKQAIGSWGTIVKWLKPKTKSSEANLNKWDKLVQILEILCSTKRVLDKSQTRVHSGQNKPFEIVHLCDDNLCNFIRFKHLFQLWAIVVVAAAAAGVDIFR